MNLIKGARIKNLAPIRDSRGYLMEILRNDDPIFEKFGQAYITNCKRGIAKAWHYHKKQTDNFCCILGKAKVVIYDGRTGSRTKGQVNEFVLEEPGTSDNVILLKIPAKVWHGFTALTAETVILNIPDLSYNRKSPDEYRMQWNDTTIPYKWPKNIKSGG